MPLTSQGAPPRPTQSSEGIVCKHRNASLLPHASPRWIAYHPSCIALPSTTLEVPGGLLLQIRRQRTLGTSGAYIHSSCVNCARRALDICAVSIQCWAPAVVRAAQSRGDVLFLSMSSSTQCGIALRGLSFLRVRLFGCPVGFGGCNGSTPSTPSPRTSHSRRARAPLLGQTIYDER
ncbi:hypothetical protein DFH06DRAFT_1377562 [Mycena polygramma]|nr:hypothetical protein DFH06DRAFT_1377562 [Mycena polygramma]